MATQAREVWMNRFIELARPVFIARGFPIPDNVRFSIGFPSGGARSKKVVGQCFYSGASDDDHHEIFVNPLYQGDTHEIAVTLTHEVCHTIAGPTAKHGPVFAGPCLAVGLLRPMTTTPAGPDWHAWAGPILEELGPFPGAALNAGANSLGPKQTTRLIKLACVCGFVCRASRSQIDAHERLLCPTGCGAQLREG